jgi:hypothetical protein
MHFKRLSKGLGLVGLAAGLMMAAHPAVAEDGCGDFQALSGTIAGMSLIDHTVFANPGMGAAISFAGDDGIMTYYRYDLGLNRISDRALVLATERSVEELGAVIGLMQGRIVRVRQSGEIHTVNEVDVHDVVVISTHGDWASVNILGIGSDGRCLHKIRYTPNMSGVGSNGRNAEGLLAFERFERVLDAMAPYFCRETCLTEM